MNTPRPPVVAALLLFILVACVQEGEDSPDVVDINGEAPDYYTPLLPPEEPVLAAPEEEPMTHSLSCFCIVSAGTWWSPPCTTGWQDQCAGYDAGRCEDPLKPNCTDSNGVVYCC